MSRRRAPQAGGEPRRSARIIQRHRSRDLLRQQPDAVLDNILNHLSARQTLSGLPAKDVIPLAHTSKHLREVVMRKYGHHISWTSHDNCSLCDLSSFCRLAKSSLSSISLRGCRCAKDSPQNETSPPAETDEQHSRHVNAASVLRTITEIGLTLSTIDTSELHLCPNGDYHELHRLLKQQCASVVELRLPAARPQFSHTFDVCGSFPKLERLVIGRGDDAANLAIADSAMICALGAVAPCLKYCDLAGMALRKPSDCYALRMFLGKIGPRLLALSVRVSSAHVTSALENAKLTKLTHLTLFMDRSHPTSLNALPEVLLSMRPTQGETTSTALSELAIERFVQVSEAVVDFPELPALVANVHTLRVKCEGVGAHRFDEVSSFLIARFISRFKSSRSIYLRSVALIEEWSCIIQDSCRQVENIFLEDLVLGKSGLRACDEGTLASDGRMGGFFQPPLEKPCETTSFLGAIKCFGPTLKKLSYTVFAGGAEGGTRTSYNYCMSPSDILSMSESCFNLEEVSLSIPSGHENCLGVLAVFQLRSLVIHFAEPAGSPSSIKRDTFRSSEALLRAVERCRNLCELKVTGVEVDLDFLKSILCHCGSSLKSLSLAVGDSLTKQDKYLCGTFSCLSAWCRKLESLKFDFSANVEDFLPCDDSSRRIDFAKALTLLMQRCPALDAQSLKIFVDRVCK